jgi:membrane-bound lytic murein transglycosylase D
MHRIHFKLMTKRRIKELAGAAMLMAALAFGASGGFAYAAASGQSGPAADVKQAQIQDIINTAERHYQKGRQAYVDGEYDQARREYDNAVDIILLASIDIRSDDQLRIYFRELIEKVNRDQIASLEQKDGGFSEQRYEPSPLDKIASLSEAELEEAGTAEEEVAVSSFNFQFTTGYPVKQFISYFTRGRGRATMEAGLQRSSRYRQMAERIFKEEGVPTDLIWLAQVESGWRPYALSHAAAKGMWQFIPATGTRFGLTQNYWVDERSNPEKSTRAAARYLKWLAARYKGNWNLALAAYNTGEGNVDAAISRSGTRDFWAIHRAGFLAQETRNYVPAILAVITIAKNTKKYGLEMPPAYQYKYETRMIASQTDLRPLAKKLKVSYGTLLDLNPELQRGVTPPGKHVIRIPAALAPASSPAESATTTDG